jgi:N-acetylmuramoyl-L-alanine amidase
MALTIQELPSPNFGPRRAVDGKVRIRHLVVHYTGMTSCQKALERLCDPKAEVSAHYLIDEDGAVYQLVSEENRAWHAGKSFWHGVRDINSTSIGVEIANPGHEYGYRAFAKQQIAAFVLLAREIMKRHSITAYNVLGHSDVAPGRKTDPGELFPWETLATEGIGLWPEDTVTLPGHPDLMGALRRLSDIGYPVPMTPELGSDVINPDSAVTDVIAAFQSRYRQSLADGFLDIETATRIASVAVRFAAARAATFPA